MKWTDDQMVGFATYCATYYNYDKGGVWTSKNGDISHVRIPSELLLEGWKMQQIPPLPSLDDLQNIRFGNDQNNETKY